MNRLTWLDITKGLAILWIVYFHLFSTYSPGVPSPIGGDFISKVAGEQGWKDLPSAIHTLGRIVSYGFVGLGFHGVGLFLVVSGWSLTQSCTKQAAKGKISWPSWYRKRLFRLFPMYWVAHLVYLGFCLASYLAARPVLVDQLEPLDSRLWISLSGLRFINIESNLVYINAAWWYFTLLIQLYLVFPLLFTCMRRFGMPLFFLGACVVGFGFRYLLLIVSLNYEALWGFSNGMWVQGGFGLCRLPEFAAGMVLGVWHQKNPERAENFLLGGRGLLLSVVAYPFALMLYRNLYGYIFVDLFTGLCFLLLAAGIAGLIGRVSWLGQIFAICGAYSYGIYLLHQPHVIFLGLRIRELPPSVFALVALAGIAVVSLWGIGVEKIVNALMQRFSAGRSGAAAPTGGT